MKYLQLIAAYPVALAVLCAVAFLGCSKSSLPNLKNSSLFGKAFVADLSSQLRPEEGIKRSGQWMESFELAHRESLRTGRPIMAAFTGSDWCGPCIQLKKKVFSTARFQSWAAENVVLLELDFPKGKRLSPEIADQNQSLADRYNVNSYPTVLIIDSDGSVKGKLGHDTNADRWIQRAASSIGS